MKRKNAVAAGLWALLCGVFLLGGSPATAQNAVLDDLFDQLQQPVQPEWESIERKIWTEWSKSGSASMDLLLQRGRDAMERGDVRDAIGHFSALIDHAPEFAEAWNARATAFFVADRYGLSVSDIEQTLRLNPRHFGALSGFGMILERLEKPDQALQVYRRALDIHPHRPDVIAAIERLEAKVKGTQL